MNHLIMQYSLASLLGPNVFLSALFWNTFNLLSFINGERQSFTST